MGNMYFDGYNYYDHTQLMEFLMLYLVIWGVAGLISIATYVLQSLSLYTIAKRRCIKKPWLAWLPVGYQWILGSIADQYRYVTLRQVTARRKALLVLEILVAVMAVVCAVIAGGMVARLLLIGGETQDVLSHLFGSMLGVWGAAMAVNCLKLASVIVSYVADYDLYRSCEPKNAVLYLVLGILIGITRPIFMIVCCKKDEGMPPRKQQSIPEAIPQPEAEPWEKAAEE